VAVWIDCSPKKGSNGFFQRQSENLKVYSENERLNNLSIEKKLGAAFGIEFIADFGVIASHFLVGKGNAFLALAAGHSCV
jgi:hypothetical protein